MWVSIWVNIIPSICAHWGKHRETRGIRMCPQLLVTIQKGDKKHIFILFSLAVFEKVHTNLIVATGKTNESSSSRSLQGRRFGNMRKCLVFPVKNNKVSVMKWNEINKQDEQRKIKCSNPCETFNLYKVWAYFLTFRVHSELGQNRWSYRWKIQAP